MKVALTTELPRHPQWSESNVSYKGNIDYETFVPRPLGLGITSVGRQDTMLATQETLITRHLLPGLSDWESLLLVVETQC